MSVKMSLRVAHKRWSAHVRSRAGMDSASSRKMRPNMRLDGRDGDMSDAQDSAGAPQAVLIAGPTASGKSALALRLAERIGGIVINADSMQVYGDLAVITARPTPAEEARVPHRLYGHVDAAVNYSVGQYVADAGSGAGTRSGAAAGWRSSSAAPGLYFKALTAGLAAVPPIPADIRAGVRARLAQDGAVALHAELQRRDPACRRPAQPQRPHARRPRARGRRGDRPLADRLATGGPAGIDRPRAGGADLHRARSRRALRPHRRALRDDAGGRRARRGSRDWRRASSIRCCRP